MDRPPQSEAGGGDQGRAGAQDRRADARGAAGDRGVEPPLSGERRSFHDRDGSLSDRHGGAGDHADHLHPCRQSAHHAALCRAPRLLDLRRALPQARPKPHQRHGGAHRADRDHRRSHGGFHRAHSGRGRAAIAFDLRDEGRHRHAAAPLRRGVEVDRPRRRAHLAGQREHAFARAPAHLSHPGDERAERGQAVEGAHPHRGPRRRVACRSRQLSCRTRSCSCSTRRSA